MYREETATICGRTYTMKTHPGLTAIDLQKGLGKYLPKKVLMILIMAQANRSAIEQLREPEVMAALLASIYGHQPELAADREPSKDLSFWIREALRYTMVDPLPFGVDARGSAYEHFDEIFSGNMGELIEVLMFVLPANFTTHSSSSPSPSGDDTPKPEEDTQGSSPKVSIKRRSSSSKTATATST